MNASFYYALLFTIVVGYLLDKELDLVNRLAPLLQGLITGLGKLKNVKWVSDLYMRSTTDFFTVNSILSLFLGSLMAGFVLLNVSEDLYSKFIADQKEQQIVQ